MTTRAELHAALDELYEAYRQPVLVEEFIDGDELTVGLVGNGPPEVLGIMRVLPQGERRPTLRLQPGSEARLAAPGALRVPGPAGAGRYRRRSAKRPGGLGGLGCRDVARFDFRLRGGVPYFLEANPLPGLSPISGDLVLLAGYVGISYSDLIARILHATLARVTAHGAATLIE